MLDRLRRAMDRLGKLGTTAVALAIWEIGARVGLPDLDAKVVSAFLKSGGANWMTRLYDLVAGGALSRGAILGLGILPYVSARIWMRLAIFGSPAFMGVSESPEGRERIKTWTRGLTVFLAALQSIGYSQLVQRIGAAPAGWGFVIRNMVVLTAGATFATLVAEYLSGRLAVETPDEAAEKPEDDAANSSMPELTSGAAPTEPIRTTRPEGVRTRE